MERSLRNEVWTARTSFIAGVFGDINLLLLAAALVVMIKALAVSWWQLNLGFAVRYLAIMSAPPLVMAVIASLERRCFYDSAMHKSYTCFWLGLGIIGTVVACITLFRAYHQLGLARTVRRAFEFERQFFPYHVYMSPRTGELVVRANNGVSMVYQEMRRINQELWLMSCLACAAAYSAFNGLRMYRINVAEERPWLWRS